MISFTSAGYADVVVAEGGGEYVVCLDMFVVLMLCQMFS